MAVDPLTRQIKEATAILKDVGAKVTLAADILKEQDLLRRGRRRERVLAAVVLGLGIAWGWGGNTARINLCHGLNSVRAAELSLWQPIVAADPKPLPSNPTVEQRAAFDAEQKQRAEFSARLEEKFRPQSC